MDRPRSEPVKDHLPHLSQEFRHRVEAATVRFKRWGGQGVLVPGGLIVTAAHVIQWSGEGHMALREFEEEIAVGGRRLRITPLAVEPVTDIAVLGALDAQAYTDEAKAFEAFCKSTAPVLLRMGDAPAYMHVLTHTGRWVAGRYPGVTWEETEASDFRRMQGSDPTLLIEMDEPITGGTSGSPIVTTGGLLVGVVSLSNYVEGQAKGEGCEAGLVRPHLAAPMWLVRRMTKSQR